MKTVLINGGSRGIGRELVLSFSEKGYKVAFTYNSSALAAESLSRECGALAIKADSANEADVVRAVREAAEQLGSLDVLINNAGVSSFSLLQDLSLREWNRVISVNLTGCFLFCREVIPYMLRSHFGRIINISSMWGITGSSCEAHYSASKAGVIGLTKALAKELGPSGITVNAIAPGLIDTEMNSSLREQDLKAIVEETPLMRIGKPRDVAASALYLAEEGASFITGDVINLSGGFVI